MKWAAVLGVLAVTALVPALALVTTGATDASSGGVAPLDRLDGCPWTPI
jgi:hypothetical protein